jgi:hypothetical protein
MFINKNNFKKYIDLYGNINNLDKYAMLSGHGYYNKDWFYYDNINYFTVQSWIDKFDGKYSALLLCICNLGNSTPKSEKSIIFLPDYIVDFRTYPKRETIFSLIVPNLGEIDSYTIDYELKRLEKIK